MLNIYKSDAGANAQNPKFVAQTRGTDEDNLDWLVHHLPANDKRVRLVLLGGCDHYSFRLRIAQSHIRHDFTPSHWSQALILGTIKEPFAQTFVHEISLNPRRGFRFPAPFNGLQRSTIDDYRDPALYPNIAIISVPVDRQRVTDALVRFQHQRAVLDGPQLVLQWLSFVWGVGRTNPLLEAQGIPSAAMIEVVIGAAGFDLTPGTESRSSCPEAIWQAAKWWHNYYQKENPKRTLNGSFHVGDVLAPCALPEDDPAPATRGRAPRNKARGLADEAVAATRSAHHIDDAYAMAEAE